MKELIAKIRAWLRKRFPSLQFTQQNIEGVLSMAARRVRKNSVVKENLTTDGDMRFLAEENGNYFPAPDEWGTAYTSMSGKGLQAIEFLLEKQDGFVPAAFTRSDIGDIDIVYGRTGEGIDDKGGYGLAHIEKRRGKGHTNWQVFADIINNGLLESVNESKVYLIGKKSKIIVALDFNKIDRKLVVSAM